MNQTSRPAQMPCPFPGCEETLTFNVTVTPIFPPSEDDSVTFRIKAEGTPESTEHAYSHKEAAK
ncbi:hypothetical protein PBI_PEAS_63 [Arthrobacter phage Peas]|uniref:Uncharacterized protein n=1 Tax=Arthrobacter phage Peas TaxID=2419965 RepID=A0A3G2KIP4_9CAUD|nr:hypothetical protein HOU51_gp63 [Arthrobacter phage Peas]AYN58750.1 hypothetical protein PBI_PEAS_63 [Arthrobacter phage Peas]